MTENRNIVGFYNVITDEYQSTPAYNLIKHASADLNNSYFLILDEMNLSHVERYFADFLSAIESGESISLYGNDEDLEIPSNLFIIGTVNVDETTYMFSPKVLDRANTIEFDTYHAKNYMVGEFDSSCPNGDIGYLENPLSDSKIHNMNINDLRELFEDIDGISGINCLMKFLNSKVYSKSQGLILVLELLMKLLSLCMFLGFMRVNPMFGIIGNVILMLKSNKKCFLNYMVLKELLVKH